MSDMNSDDNKKGGSGRTLSLKGSGSGTVRQNLSHGRSKQVVVETRKRKFLTPKEKAAQAKAEAEAKAAAAAAVSARIKETEERVATPPPPGKVVRETPAAVEETASVEQTPVDEKPAAPQKPEAAPVEEAPKEKATPVKAKEQEKPGAPTQKASPERTPAAKASKPAVASKVRGRNLSKNEMDARLRALESAKERAAEDEERAAEMTRRRAAEEEFRRKQDEEAAKRAADEQRRAEEKLRAEKKAAKAAQVSPADAEAAAARGETKRGGGMPTPARRPEKEDAKPSRNPRGNDQRRRGKLTLANATGDGEGRSRSMAAMRRRQEKIKRAQSGQSSGPREKVAREVQLPETITIQELAQRMAERSVDVVKYLMKEGQMMKPGDLIDADLAQLIAEEFGHTVKRVTEADVEEGIFDVQDKEEDLEARAPVVTIMGHVDHGKTSLLDAIRNARVTAGEAGGITQHIGAYQVEQSGQKITFLDTPGHAAFTAMRARGAQATDIAVLVVAADDAVMPQTIESIAHIKASGVPMIVAINKIDKPTADPQKVRTDLLQHEVFVESMGGDTQEVEVSALKGTNLDGLLEAILLQSEVLELKANPNRSAEGTVVEAKLDKGRGAVATVLVQTGTLKVGDILVAGSQWGKVRALVNDQGEQVSEALPSTPVEVLGLNGTPQAGDRVAVVDSEARAREISDYRQRVDREKAVARQTGARGSLEQMMALAADKDRAEFPLLIKGDVQGSVEAINGALEKMSTEEVIARVVHSGAGGITETDVSLAESTGAAIMGFNVRANKQARDAAEAAGVEIRYYNIIYNLLDDVKAAMEGLLTPERRETFLGNAEMLEIFNITKVGKIAGCRVTEGKVERGAGVRLIRDNVVIHEGKLKTLKRFKDEVAEVPSGQECGMAFENYEDIREGDIVECFRVEEIARKLDA
ncbi:translation initiation factor IF-2 [Ahrensia marina]|uniref:Translation initiation factor IF-2 n=1 Tax=Ahrensia marina TaxID=1514904 RepID=A0A0M9GNH0_9HYPH|nr:translation initiation factor IF-2 [Ahrensia marina]KPB01930.1 translation initiation factor IF-2 [Ahrensia marina]